MISPPKRGIPVSNLSASNSLNVCGNSGVCLIDRDRAVNNVVDVAFNGGDIAFDIGVSPLISLISPSILSLIHI